MEHGIMDVERGIMDRLLVGPTRRSALIGGRLVPEALAFLVQAIIGGLAWLPGARFESGLIATPFWSWAPSC